MLLALLNVAGLTTISFTKHLVGLVSNVVETFASGCLRLRAGGVRNHPQRVLGKNVERLFASGHDRVNISRT